mmetsp:Transcript_50833/g.111287  ORF Transcript_50833/g.111287 Transcript_50833/m.111287 type:complete len:1383 (-) Transcript_50833:157-4305(-)
MPRAARTASQHSLATITEETRDQGRVDVALEALKLEEVDAGAHRKVCEAHCTYITDFEVETEHITVGMLDELKEALVELPAASRTAFWEKMNELASGANSAMGALPVHKALTATLAQILCDGGDRAPAAALSYIALLTTEGAEPYGVFVAVVVREIAKALEPLIHRRKVREVEEDEEMMSSQADPGCLQEVLTAVEQLTARISLRGQELAYGALVDLLADIVLAPVDEAAGQSATVSLFNMMLDLHGEPHVLASQVLKCMVPALALAEKDSGNTSIAKHAMTRHARALAFTTKVFRERPVLLAGQEEEVMAPPTNQTDEPSASSMPPPPPLTIPRNDSDPALALLQHICMRTPERAEWRQVGADTVVKIMVEAATSEQINPELFADRLGLFDRFTNFLEQMLRCDRVGFRVLAAELSLSILEQRHLLSEAGDPASVAKMVKALVGRCSDAVPSVRSKALLGVAVALNCLGKNQEPATTTLLESLILSSPGHHPTVPIAGLLRSRGADEKPVVRRSACGFFEKLLPFLLQRMKVAPGQLVLYLSPDVLYSLATDESVMVRKAALGTVGLYLEACPSLSEARACWTNNVLPAVIDVEVGVVEKAIDAVQDKVIAPVVAWSKGQAGPFHETLVAEMLSGLSCESLEYLQRNVRAGWKRNNSSFPKPLLSALGAVVKWCLTVPPTQWPMFIFSILEEVAAVQADALPMDGLVKAWKQLEGVVEDASGHVLVVITKILRCIGHGAARVAPADAKSLGGRLLTSLTSFRAGTAVIKDMMSLLAALAVAHPTKVTSESWTFALFQTIQGSLTNYCSPPEDVAGGAPDEVLLERQLFTFGELALLSAKRATPGMVMMVQTIATNTVYRGTDKVTTGVGPRSMAFVALGKCALRSEALAKKLLELFVLHLHEKENFVVRNNVLLVLSDLAIHYTAMVDRFVPHLSDCIRDPNELLRKQSLMALSSLVAEDFIKFKGSILLRFVYALSDPRPPVRQFIEAVFVRILHQRHSTIFAQSFVDIICGLNGWNSLAGYQAATGNAAFSLAGHPHRREMIYKFMCKLLNNEQKFTVMGQVVTNILSAFVDGEDVIPIPDRLESPTGQVLLDCFALLSCKELKVSFAKSAAEPGEGGDDNPAAEVAAALERTKTNVLSAILKRNMGENVVPILVQLKGKLEKLRSPFLKPLRTCLREVLRDFRDDLKGILRDDTLASEIDYDIAQQEQPEVDKAQGRRSLALAQAGLTPMTRTSGGSLGGFSRPSGSASNLPRARRSTSCTPVGLPPGPLVHRTPIPVATELATPGSQPPQRRPSVVPERLASTAPPAVAGTPAPWGSSGRQLTRMTTDDSQVGARGRSRSRQSRSAQKENTQSQGPPAKKAKTAATLKRNNSITSSQ